MSTVSFFINSIFTFIIQGLTNNKKNFRVANAHVWIVPEVYKEECCLLAQNWVELNLFFSLLSLFILPSAEQSSLFSLLLARQVCMFLPVFAAAIIQIHSKKFCSAYWCSCHFTDLFILIFRITVCILTICTSSRHRQLREKSLEYPQIHKKSFLWKGSYSTYNEVKDH